MSLLSTAARTVADWVKLGFPEEVASSTLLPAAAAGLLATQSDDAEASVVTPAIKSILANLDSADADRIAREITDGWFVHNTEKFDAPADPERFAQHLEPSGQYVTPTSGARSDLPDSLVQGQKDFKNPLMIESSGGYQSPDNWKHRLSQMYGGATGSELSSAIRADGYDGIYTIEKGPRGAYLSESVDLNMGKSGSALEDGNADPRLLAGIAAGGAGATAAPSLLQMADEYSGKVIDALEMPYKGLLGLGRFGGGLLAGEGLDAAIDSAVRQIKQPIDKTADEVGDSLLKTTGSPEAATLANLLVQFHPSALF